MAAVRHFCINSMKGSRLAQTLRRGRFCALIRSNVCLISTSWTVNRGSAPLWPAAKFSPRYFGQKEDTGPVACAKTGLVESVPPQSRDLKRPTFHLRHQVSPMSRERGARPGIGEPGLRQGALAEAFPPCGQCISVFYRCSEHSPGNSAGEACSGGVADGQGLRHGIFQSFRPSRSGEHQIPI